MSTIVQIKRVYDKPLLTDKYRVLVDKLWPRGLTKEEAEINDWAKLLAPSTDLRKWFNHDPALWVPFQKSYLAELKKNTAVDPFIEKNADKKLITLLYAAKDTEHNHAIVLRKYLQQRFNKS